MTTQSAEPDAEQSAASAAVLNSLVDLIRTARAVGHRESDKFGITGTPLGILRRLAVGDARGTELACTLQIAPSVVSRAVAPLEQAGLLERRQDPDDARAWRFGLTELGREQLAERQRRIHSQFGDVLLDWDPADMAQLARLMRRLEQAIASRLDPPAPQPRPLADGLR